MARTRTNSMSSDGSYTMVGDSPAPSATRTGDHIDVDIDMVVLADDDGSAVASVPSSIPPRGAFSSKIIQVLVGREWVVFEIQEDVLSFYSQNFKSRLSMPDSIVLRLKEDSAVTFELFQHWAYTRTLPAGDSHDTSSSTGELCTRRLCQLWIFGEKYGIPQLQNDMVGKIVERVMHSPWKDPAMHATYVYAHTDHACLRFLITDLISVSIGVKAFRRGRWNQEAMSYVADGVEDGVGQPQDLAKWDLTMYHVLNLE